MRIDPETVPVLLRRAGVVGAGGAGFPAYVKYQRPTKVYVANCTESEPGYYGDKMLMKERPDVICKALKLLRDIFGYEKVYLAIKAKHTQYATEVIHYAEETGDFAMAYVPDQYRMGEEKALTKHVTGIEVPRGAIPPKVGVTVQNTETLHNIYWALTEHRPVIYKFVQTIGEIRHDEVLQAPVGTPVQAVLRHAGHKDPDEVLKKHRLIDGGPLLGEEIEEPGGHVVTRTTNGLLFVKPENFKRRGKLYPLPDHEPPSRIQVVADEVDVVEVPLGGPYGEPAIPVVNEGDTVAAGQEIGHYDPEKLSVSAHASIPGVVTRVGPARIRIERQSGA